MKNNIKSGKIRLPQLAKVWMLSLILSMVYQVGFSKEIKKSGKYFQIEYAPSTSKGELQIGVTYTLWIPEGAKTIRGVIVHQHGAGIKASEQGLTAANDLHWQALAKKWDCALMGSSYHVLNDAVDLTPGGAELWFDARLGSDKVFLNALGQFAKLSGYKEIETSPWILWGHSGGGIWSNLMANLHPDRVVAIWLRSGTAIMFRGRSEFLQPEIQPAVYGIPVMCNAGVKEKGKAPWAGSLATFQEYRSKGAPIGFAPDPRTGHECGDARYLAIPFLDACMAMRLPDVGSKSQTLKPIDMKKAWFASLSDSMAFPVKDFKGNAEEAVWLPNKTVAKYWEAYVRTGAVDDRTPPPAPFDLQVSGKKGKGVELTWNAEADFESGIRCFLIFRDGKELAQVPESPYGKWGRPLFQTLSHGDTPTPSSQMPEISKRPEMLYVDNQLKAGEEHSYTVVSVNSVGLKSKPSKAVSLILRPEK